MYNILVEENIKSSEYPGRVNFRRNEAENFTAKFNRNSIRDCIHRISMSRDLDASSYSFLFETQESLYKRVKLCNRKNTMYS